ncbi:hypothetical protein [Chromobacterium vaccinii]|uniref:hypothetical protein n=1 Tax=Chromobacterium vaccinii TaxID=1108595 RepID=UPI0011AB3665|nr:hypothetical protein [Chromobacterium vaccinii]
MNIPFERYTFINGLDAICAYDKGEIEALVRPIVSPTSPRIAYARLFGIPPQDMSNAWPDLGITLTSPTTDPVTTVSLSQPTNELSGLLGLGSQFALSLKIQREGVSQHDQAETILKKFSDALFFQIDLLTDVPLSLARDRNSLRVRPRKKKRNTQLELKYPSTEYDSAPVSLYWYARSAVGMPLLQFLAYYQVIEFYYPTYSQAEARRRLKGILKDPTFRGDRDADIGRVLSAIQITRSGAVGDERSQLKATLSECIDPDALRDFLMSDPQRVDFLSSKAKGLTDHRLPLAATNVDLRNDVAERIYEIRCKIVHTKTDARTGDFELLLPFSKKAEQLHFDIELVQYLAQQVLVNASTSI